MAAAVILENLSFQYSKHKIILNKVNLTLNKGTVTGIIGESGIGKTSILRIINGSMMSDNHFKIEGSIRLNGLLMKKEEDYFRQTGTVYQNPDNQIIFSNVEDELAFGMENMGVEAELMTAKIIEVLKLMGIMHLRERNPNELSGGEKQLVILAAILCLDIEIIILDECMTQIDYEGRSLIIEAIERLRRDGKTIIMVEHDYENLAMADQVYRLIDQQLVQVDKGSLIADVLY